MTQSSIESVVSSPSNLATAGATVVAVAIPLIYYAASKLKQKYYEYDADEMKVINQIRELYRRHCYPQECKGSLSTQFTGFSGEGELNRDLPIYFQMDPANKKQPMFFTRNIKTIMEAHEWEVHLQTKSSLTEVSGGIKDMIGHICNYQAIRNEGVVMVTEEFGVGGKGYHYDPTNLFLEEFKRWLVQLSNAPLNEETLANVEGRMNYLRKIDVCDVFKQSGRIVTRRETVIKLLANLSNTIRPIILTYIAAQSSREHYDLLKKNITALIRTSAQFCFYVFRDTAKTPANFILENMQQAKNNYEPIMLSTRTGLLLNQLFNCPAAKVMQNKDKDIARQDLQFAGSINELLSDSPKYEKVDWGMLPVFRSYAVLQKYYRLHSLIERLFIFEKIADDLYGLAGKGGDILVYGYLAPQTHDAMHSYCVLLHDLESIIHEIHQIADQHRIAIIEREKVGATKDEKRWIKNFAQADIAFEQLCYRWSKINGSEKSFSTIGESIKLVRKIQQKMDQVNTPEYKEQLLRDIAKFSRWMVLFSGNELLPHEVNKKFDDSSQSKQPEVQTPVAKAVAPANKKPLQAQIGNDSFSFVLEQQDIRSDSVFLLLGAGSREECINRLIEVCNQEVFVELVTAEIKQVYKGKKIPAIIEEKLLKKYHRLLIENKAKEADEELNTLCLKSKSFVRNYVQQRYLVDKAGIPYIPNRKGVLHALATIYERECYVLQLGNLEQLNLLERIECSLAKNPPVFLLYCDAETNIDYPHFDRLIDLRQSGKDLLKVNSGLGFFSPAPISDKGQLLQQAEQAYLASQIKGIKREEWIASLEIAIHKIDALIDLEPKNHKFHLLRGIYLASKGDPNNRLRSITDFDLALKHCPANDNGERCKILIERGITYANIQNVDRAIADFTELLKIDPNNHRARLMRADLYTNAKNDYKNAIADYSYVIGHLKEGELYLKALKSRIAVAMLNEDYRMVVEDAQAYLALEPNDHIVESKREQAVMKLTEKSSKKGLFGK